MSVFSTLVILAVILALLAFGLPRIMRNSKKESVAGVGPRMSKPAPRIKSGKEHHDDGLINPLIVASLVNNHGHEEHHGEHHDLDDIVPEAIESVSVEPEASVSDTSVPDSFDTGCSDCGCGCD